MSMLFENVKMGDRVWLGSGANKWAILETVSKVTPRQILMSDGDRYRRDDGRAVGGAFLRATGVATPEQIERWETERAERERQTAERTAERVRIAAKREELNDLFGDNAYVREEDGQWEVRITTDEDGVRNIARLLADGI